MESAIPNHLKCPRKRDRRTPEDYAPPYPSVVARYKPDVKQVVMAYFGLQYRGESAPEEADRSLQGITGSLSSEEGPGHWDRAVYVDEAGFTNVVSTGYWDTPAEFDAWFTRHGAGWAGDTAAESPVGTFTEVLRPAVERFETLFSSNDPEGVACLADGFSEPVQEHAYWGAARDRIPISQTNDMAPAGEPQVAANGLCRRVIPHENICLIRSGQDWSATSADERRMYLDDVEPVLRAGMDFLRDDGLRIGCFANRYMTAMDAGGRTTEKTFSMSWWKSLSALERWAESHPTHVAIFGAAMKYFSTLGPAVKLKLYHEVTVASTGEQYFEYYNCHPKTGMLRAAASSE